MWRFYLLVAIIWLALLPPVFTGGSCTAEFDAVDAEVARHESELGSSALAVAFWKARAVPVALLTLDTCRQAKPRFLDHCGPGPLVYAKVPVNDRICSFYRDDSIKVQLHYDERDRLTRYMLDMSPYHSLPVPFTSYLIHWAR